jgi:hypothetical protein
MQFGGSAWGRYRDTVPNPITIPSLEALLRNGSLSVRHIRQHYGVGTGVGELRIVDGDRVALVLKNRAFIDSLFSMRPSHVTALWRVPFDTGIREVRVGVTYIAPEIPDPDSAARARYEHVVADFDRKYRSVERSIDLLPFSANSPYLNGDRSIQIQAGDSAMVVVMQTVIETSGLGFPFEHRNWSIGDSSIAAVRHHEPLTLPSGAQQVTFGHSGFWLVARAPGRTTIRAHDIAPYTGKRAGNTPPAELSRDVVVIPRLASVRIIPATDTVSVNTRTPVRIEARDPSGALVRGLKAIVRTRWSAETVADSGSFTLREPGRHSVAIELHGLRDTAWVFVR